MVQAFNVFDIAGFVGVPAVVSGLVLWWFTRKVGRLDRNVEARRQETVLILRGLLTIGGLASATASAVKYGQANGGVSEALAEYAQYREDLSAFLVEQTAKK
jgi:hypothetical protein